MAGALVRILGVLSLHLTEFATTPFVRQVFGWSGHFLGEDAGVDARRMAVDHAGNDPLNRPDIPGGSNL